MSRHRETCNVATLRDMHCRDIARHALPRHCKTCAVATSEAHRLDVIIHKGHTTPETRPLHHLRILHPSTNAAGSHHPRNSPSSSPTHPSSIYQCSRVAPPPKLTLFITYASFIHLPMQQGRTTPETHPLHHLRIFTHPPIAGGSHHHRNSPTSSPTYLHPSINSYKQGRTTPNPPTLSPTSVHCQKPRLHFTIFTLPSTLQQHSSQCWS